MSKILLQQLSWETFRTYLLYDKKISHGESNIWANKSRFKIIKDWFVSKSLDFNRANFTHFIGEMEEKGYKESYLNKYISIAKTIAEYFEINHNIINEFKLHKVTYFTEERNIDYDTFTPDEIVRMANVELPYKKGKDYINQRQKILILISGLIGPRVGEMINLKWASVHETPHYFYLTFKETKTKKQRKVPIGRKFGEMLMELPKNNKEYVLTSYRGKKLRSQELGRDIKRRAIACGITKNVWNHLFRHTAITELLQNGIEVTDVGDIVGQDDPKTTMRYKHVQTDHYYDVMLAHPLLANEMTWQQQMNRIQQNISKLIASKFPLKIDPLEDRIVVTLYRGKY